MSTASVLVGSVENQACSPVCKVLHCAEFREIRILFSCPTFRMSQPHHVPWGTVEQRMSAGTQLDAGRRELFD